MIKKKKGTEKHVQKQIIEEPTRIAKSLETLTDQLFTNRPDRIKTSYNLATGLSDHNMLLFVRKLKTINVSSMKQDQCQILKTHYLCLKMLLLTLTGVNKFLYGTT